MYKNKIYTLLTLLTLIHITLDKDRRIEEHIIKDIVDIYRMKKKYIIK